MKKMTLDEAVAIADEHIDHGGVEVVKALQFLRTYVKTEKLIIICQHHKRHEQCVWGLRGCCKDSPCEINYNLRKK